LIIILIISILVLLSTSIVNASKEGRSLIDSLLSELPIKSKDTNAVNLLSLLSKNYYIIDPDSGLYYGYQGLQIAEELGWKKGMAKAKNSLGANYSAKSMTAEATKNYLETSRIYEEIGDRSGILRSYGDVAMLYSIVERYDQAIEYYHKTINMAKELNSDIELGRNYSNLGIVYKYLKKSDSAQYYFSKSSVIFEKLNHKSYLSLNYFNSGSVFIDDSSYAKAYDHTIKALEISKEIGNKRLIALINVNLGHIYKMNYFYPEKLKPRPDFLFAEDSLNLLKSIEYLEEAKSALAELDDKKNLMEALDGLSELYLLKHDFEKAAQARQLYSELQDSLMSVEAHRQIAFLDARREIDMKDQQIKMSELKLESTQNQLIIIVIALIIISIIAIIFYRLNIQNRRINQKLIEQSRIISDQVATKDKFFSIIAHDLRNPISAMAQSIEMLKKEFYTFDSEEIREFITDLNRSSKNVYALLEDLLTWSRSQRGMIEAHKESYNASDIAARAISQLESQAKAKKINLVNNVSPDESVFIDANLTITMLRNMLSNAIKFSEEGSQVEVDLTKCKDGLSQYSITDHGVGMDQKTVDNLFKIDSAQSGIGTAGEKGTGLGLIVCKEFADKQNGKITAESNEGEGSTFKFTFPDEDCEE
jgi:signal transduction histidine kinase